MPSDPVILVAGDTAPPLDLVLRRRGVPFDVTGATLAARIERESGATLTKTPTIVDGPNGVVRITWSAGDLVDNAGQPADYRVEVTVNGQTNPVPHTFTVRPRIA